MSKVITSPVKKFPGTVTLSDPLTFPQVFAVEDALDKSIEVDSAFASSRARYAVLPAIIECVEKWELEGIPENVTVETFPATPPTSTARLIAWLINEIVELFKEAEPDPNE